MFDLARRLTSAWMPCLLLVTGLGPTGCAEPQRPPPNVLLVTIDTLRADHLGSYGYERPTSPEFDRLAKEGALFENTFVAASFSGPSYASILTGTFPFTHTVRNHPRSLPDEALTLAELLGGAGYRTGAIVFGKHFINRRWNYGQGFQYFDRSGNGKQTTAKAIRWMNSSDQPFFLWLLYNEPHFPYAPPKPFDRIFGAAPPGYSIPEDLRSGSLNQQELSFAIERLDLAPEQIEHTIARYDGEIRYVDGLVSLLRKWLHNEGALERTLIVVTADHGEALGEGSQYFTHDASIHDAALHVPLLFRLPGTFPPGTRVSQVVRSVDIAPTILAALGQPIPEVMEGVSLLPTLTGKALNLEAYAESRRLEPSRMELGLLHYPLEVPGLEGKQTMLRSGELKLVRHPRKDGVEYRLYDTASDPEEAHDLAAERPDDLAAMKARMEDWRSRDTKPESDAELSHEDILKLRALGYVN